ncbi:MAG: class I SAM-dependent methyltransferase [Flavobacteriales bacterium]
MMAENQPWKQAVEPYTEYVDYPVHMQRLIWLMEFIQSNRRADGTRIRILDVGCGTGNITIPLGLLPDADVVGIDMFQPNIDLVRERNSFPNVSVQFSRLSDFDVADFDFIIFTEVLEHIPGYRDILEDLSLRMKSSAHILVTIPNGWGPFEWAMTPMYFMRRIGLNGFIGRVKKLLGKKEPYALNQEIDPHVNFFTRSQLQKDSERFSLQLSEISPAFFMAPIMETYLPFISLQKIAPADYRFAKRLPIGLASGWYFSWKKKTADTAH